MDFSQLRICRPSPLRKDYTCMKDAHIAELNEKSIFQFLISELWLIVFKIYMWHTLLSKCVTDKINIYLYIYSLKSGQIYIKDAQWAETNEIQFSNFYFRIMFNFVRKTNRKLTHFEHKYDHISKNKNRKIDFWFVSAHSASSTHIKPLLKKWRKTFYSFG